MSYSQLLQVETEMVVSYRIVPYLQHRYAWVVMGNADCNYTVNTIYMLWLLIITAAS